MPPPSGAAFLRRNLPRTCLNVSVMNPESVVDVCVAVALGCHVRRSRQSVKSPNEFAQNNAGWSTHGRHRAAAAASMSRPPPKREDSGIAATE